MNDNDLSTTEALLSLAHAAALPIGLDHPDNTHATRRGVMIPKGYELQSLEEYNPRPWSKRGHPSFRDAESFAAYVNCHKEPGTCLFADTKQDGSPHVFAVIDHHQTLAAGWGDHIAFLKCTPTAEWEAWKGIDGRALTQLQFAEFLEDHLGDVAEPAGATLLEIAKKFNVARSMNFESALDLHNGGVQLAYSETDSTKGKITIPQTLVLGLAPFDESPRYRLDARLRYRLEAGGKLALVVKLTRPDLVVKEAAAARVFTIQDLTGLVALLGSSGSLPTPPITR